MAYGYAAAPTNRQNRHMAGKNFDIFLRFILITFPMIALSGIILALVFHYRVRHNGTVSANLSFPGSQDERGVYYVKLNATFLVFIASRSSSAAPLLVGFAVTLASYPIARRHLADVRENRRDQLMTPYQLGLVLELLGGRGMAAAWHWFKYIFFWRGRMKPQVRCLGNAILIFLVATLLGWLIFISDTWLHVSTKAVNFTQTTPLNPTPQYSYGLSPGCLTSNNSVSAQTSLGSTDQPCTIQEFATGAEHVGASISLQVLNNISSTAALKTYTSDSPYVYLGVTPSDGIAQIDYTAYTYAVQSQCKPISRACNLIEASGASNPFNCPDYPTVSGDLTAVTENNSDPSWQAFWFSDASGQQTYTPAGVQNPFSFILAAVTNPTGGGTVNPDADPEIVRREHGGLAFILFCTLRVTDVDYSTVNDSITRFVSTTSNTSVANIIQSTYFLWDLAKSKLQEAASLATFSNSSQELANKFTISLAQTGLGLASGGLQPQLAMEAQRRASMVVSRVPVAPLMALVACNLLFALLGTVLAALAGATATGEVRDVQARLSTVGLVADRFEGARARMGFESREELFEEKDGRATGRIGIDSSQYGGYEYKIWAPYPA